MSSYDNSSDSEEEVLVRKKKRKEVFHFPAVMMMILGLHKENHLQRCNLKKEVPKLISQALVLRK